MNLVILVREITSEVEGICGMSIDFQKMMRPVARESLFTREDAHVWCGSIVKGKDGKYYLFYSCFTGVWGWVLTGEIGLAVSDRPTGPYEDLGTLITGAGGDAWDAHAVHNPCCMEWQDKYYLYYMGSKQGADANDWLTAWSNKQIGVMVADRPQGPWTRSEEPVLRSEKGTWTETLVSNPSVCVRPDGKFLMIYKGAGPLIERPEDCLFTCGVAVADSPSGPFVKVGGPQFLVPKQLWAVEDPSVWYDRRENKFYCVLKDFHGYHNGTNTSSNSLFESADGLNWQVSEHPLAALLVLRWNGEPAEAVRAFERLSVYCENGQPVALAAAVRFMDGRTGNVQVALRSE